MAFAGSTFHLHGLSAGKKKELGALVEANGGVVSYIFGKTVRDYNLIHTRFWFFLSLFFLSAFT